MSNNSKYRNAQNQLLTRGLFHEVNFTSPETSIYTLGREDKITEDGQQLISLYRRYMEIGDIHEYDFANECFESWDHWQSVANSWFMKKIVEKWREELEVRTQSDALKMIQAEAIADSKYSYAANRYLADKGWKQEQNTKRKGAGRPTKASLAEEANQLAADSHDVDKDIKRLGLNVN